MLWETDVKSQSVSYSLDELLRRANLKLKVNDREVLMGSDVWGKMPLLVKRINAFNKLKQKGISKVKVYYDQAYFSRYWSNPQLLDPLHLENVLQYEASN